MPYKKDFVDFIDKFLISGFLAMIGVIALQLNEYRKGHKTSTKNMVIHLFLASFVGYITRCLLPDSLGAVKPGLVAISGYIYKTILLIIEKDGIKLLLKNYKGKK